MKDNSSSYAARSAATTVNAEVMDVEDKPRHAGDCCDLDSCSDSLDAVTDSVHVKLLKIFGGLAVTFSIAEACIGTLVFKFVVNYALGAWWISILAFFAGFCAIGTRNRGWVTAACVLASVSVGVSLIGSIIDIIAASILVNLSACVSKNDYNVRQYYGNSQDYSRADACILLDGPSYVVGGCYCVTTDGTYCGEYTLSSFSKSYGMGCANVIDTFPKLLSSSAACAVLTLVSVVVVSVMSCVVLCCPRRSPLIQYPTKDPEVGDEFVVGYSNVFDKY